MKKILSILLLSALIFILSPQSVNAETYDDIKSFSKADSLMEILPDDTKNSLKEIGIYDTDYTDINNITFNDIINEIMAISARQSSTPLKILASVIAVMLLYSILYSIKTSAKTTSMKNVLSVCITLCITCIIVIPICSVIDSAISVIESSANFLIAYIPVMLLIIASSGHPVSGASYYSMMILAGQGVAQISSNIISPFLKIFLGISVTSAISPNVNLSGIVAFVSRVSKWLLGFVMTLFTALLTFKQLITTSMDNVSTRAVRFTLTSLVPVVGSALSDAYKTVQSSVGLLKSGVGVFVIIAVAIVFLPALIQCLFWMMSLGLCKATGEILNLKEPCMLLSAINTVVTTIFAILLCIMSIFIISTALVLMLGGGGG